MAYSTHTQTVWKSMPALFIILTDVFVSMSGFHTKTEAYNIDLHWIYATIEHGMGDKRFFHHPLF